MERDDYNMIIDTSRACGNEFSIDLHYPPYENEPCEEGQIKYITVGLSAVRAADDVRIHYNFERDGWVVEQSSIFEWEPGDNENENYRDWQEVAFIQAWGRERK